MTDKRDIKSRDLAKIYAAKGYKVLATYTVVRNDDGELVCACWRTRNGVDACGKSSGKHPHADISPNGSSSATDDLDEIDNWPESGYNLGIAFNGSFMCIDVDDPTVATALMQEESLRRTMPMASTGRAGGGVHIYIQCAEETTPTELVTTDGKKIADLMGLGRYTVLPPAVHKSGRSYQWLGNSLLEQPPQEYAKDGYDFAVQLLGMVGVEIRPKREAIDLAGLGGPIERCDLPFPIPNDALLIQQMLTGTYPSNDRSHTLYTLACSVYRLAATSGVEIDERTVAGYVKKLDAAWKHGKGPKFFGRRDADQRYWEVAVGAKRDTQPDRDKANKVTPIRADVALPEAQRAEVDDAVVVVDGAAPDDGLPPDDNLASSEYFWTRLTGFCWRPSDKKDTKRICNFRPQIIEIHEVWDGDEQQDDVWVLKLGTLDPIHIRVDAREELRSVMKAINRALPPEYIIEPDMSDRFWAGIRAYSTRNGDIPRRRSYAATGWLPNQDAFLLPGAPGAITATGIDESIQYENSLMPTRWMAYGVDVRPQDVDLADVLRKLYGMSVPSTTVPLLTQIWAAPLASLGADRDAAIVHLHVRTGSLKTSMLKVAMSVYGRFNTNSTYFDPWTSTYAAIQGSWYRIRDLPMVIDDYKAAMLAGRTKDVSAIIQNYADRTGRTRSSPNQKEQVSQRPRCLMLSSGEDIWEGQESTNARTIIVVPPSAATKEEKALAYARISPAQALATAGHLGVAGYEWIRWLCSVGQTRLRPGLAQLQERMRTETAAFEPMDGVHGRVSASMANIQAVDHLFQKFLDARVPDFAEEYRKMAGYAWLAVMRNAAEDAKEAAKSAPFDMMIEEIRNALVTGGAQFIPRTDADSEYAAGFNGAEIIGFVDRDWVYVNKTLTFSWLEKRVRQRGGTATLGWRSFSQDAVNNHHCVATNVPQYMAGTRIRTLAIPHDDVITDEIVRMFAP